MQTTLLGLAIAFIIALLAALIGPYFIDWNQFRPQFEAEASKVIGAPVRVAGDLSARLLPTPSLRLRYIVVGRANDLGKVRAEKLDVEFSLGDLMRGEWRANELSIGGAALDIGLDSQGRVDWPIANGKFNLGSLSIDRLNLSGRVALHDAASRQTLEMNDIDFSGDVRSLTGSVRGEGSFALAGTRYGFHVSSGQIADNSGTRVHFGIDPSDRAPSTDIDGVLSFDGRAPRFDGAVTLAAAPQPKAKAGEDVPAPWRIVAKVKVDRTAAQFEQIDLSYGNDERALKLAGFGDVRFDPLPQAHVTLTARQLDADRFLLAKDNAKDSTKDNTRDPVAEPVRLLPGLRTLLAALPHPPIATLVNFSTEQIMLGGRPLLNLSADLHTEATGSVVSWAVDRLDFHAPGATQITLSAGVSSGSLGNFSGVLDVDSSDPDVLMMWLQGRTDVGYRSQKPLRLRGNLDLSADRTAIEALSADLDGGAVEGRLALLNPPGGVSRFEAALKAERLDIDAIAAFARSVAGPQADWPDEAQVSLDVGRALSAGQELRKLTAKFGYTPKALVIEKLKFGQPDSVTLEGNGNFDRTNSTGRLSLDSTTASLGQLTGLFAPFAPQTAARLNTLGTGAGPVRVKLALDLGKGKDQSADRATARADLELDAPSLKARATMTTMPPIAAIRGLDFETLRRGEISLDTRFSAQRGDSLIALLGLDRAVAAGEGAVQFEGSLNGTWGAPLRVNAKLWGAGMDADAQGTAEPWASQASMNLRVRSVNLAPVFGLKPQESPLRNVRLFARASLAGNKLTLDDLDSVAAGSRLRGRLTLNLDEPREVNGEVGLDSLDLTSALAFAMGASSHDSAEPLASGLVKGWRGRIAFQALGGTLPGGGELRPVSGTMVSDGQSLTLDSIKGRIGGGDAAASIDARQDSSGVALNARVDLSNVDGAALHYRGLKMPAGHTSLQMTLSSQGRSVAALAGALSGSGTVTLESATLTGLDPRAFDVAIRASDSSQLTDDARLRQLVDPVLAAGALQVASAQIPFSIRDGRLRVGATTLEAADARAIISGGYDFPADQVDIRASLASTAANAPSGLPEIQLFAVGPPDSLNRSIDVAALSSWLAVRTIDRETRRLDSIERGMPQPPEPALVPPSTASLPAGAVPDPAATDPSLLDVPRRVPPKPRLIAPRPPALAPAPPVVSQQAAPLPPPIDVKPAPGSTALKPKPRAPMLLTPPLAIP